MPQFPVPVRRTIVSPDIGIRAPVVRDRPWRQRFKMLTARFKYAAFHVEQQARSSGRRIVEHEYPKRDMPYGEDMGRHAIRYTITGYVIDDDLGSEFYNDYQASKNRLIQALEEPDPGVLIDPYLAQTSHLDYVGGTDKVLMFHCERYSVSETRQRGGYAIFEMSFVEAGQAAHTTVYQLTEQKVQDDSRGVMDEAADALDQEQQEIHSGIHYGTPHEPPAEWTPPPSDQTS